MSESLPMEAADTKTEKAPTAETQTDECPLCLCPIEEPFVMSCCGKRFCSQCQALQDKCVECPFCRSAYRLAVAGDSLEHHFRIGSDPDGWVTEAEEDKKCVCGSSTDQCACRPAACVLWPPTLILDGSQQPLLKLVFKDLQSRKFIMSVSSDMRIQQFKWWALDKVGAKKISLVHLGRPLLDDQTFASSGVKNLDVVHVLGAGS